LRRVPFVIATVSITVRRDTFYLFIYFSDAMNLSEGFSAIRWGRISASYDALIGCNDGWPQLVWILLRRKLNRFFAGEPRRAD